MGKGGVGRVKDVHGRGGVLQAGREIGREQRMGGEEWREVGVKTGIEC